MPARGSGSAWGDCLGEYTAFTDCAFFDAPRNLAPVALSHKWTHSNIDSHILLTNDYQEARESFSRHFIMKYLAIALCLVCANAPAAGPLIGFEYESERNESSGITNHAVDIVPGWEFSDERFINRIELLIDKNQDNKADADGLLAKENKLFIRIRHDGDLTDALGYYIRGGIGRSFNNQRNFNFAYVEPGVEYKFTNDWAWTLAIREGNAIDGAPGHRLTQLRTGPSLDLGKNAEFELIYAKGRGDSNLTSWIFEYVYKF